MNMKKNSKRLRAKWLRQVVVLLLAISLLAGCQNRGDTVSPADVEESKISDPTGVQVNEKEEIMLQKELLVGNPTVTSGNFFTEMFGNNTADIDVQALIHGYNLVSWDQSQGRFVLDPSVVYSYRVSKAPNGDKTYDLTLWKDLKFSDGSPITAWDYAFSMLLMMSSQVEEIGGKIYRAEHLAGYADYLSGNTRELKAVRVTGDYELSVTLDHNYLPNFYEEGLLLCNPYPISVLAPGCKVYDDGKGIYIGDVENSATSTNYTAELLRKTILDLERGYNTHPSVSSGPYTLTAYDGKTCYFQRNPYYKGSWSGGRVLFDTHPDFVTKDTDANGNTVILIKPPMEEISFTVADNDTLLEDFQNGKLHLANKITYGPTIDKLLESEELQHQDYPRVGLSFLAFSCDWPTVSEIAVRQAIAWCMDRDQLTESYCGSYGARIDGYYGRGQWEALLVSGELAAPVEKVKSAKEIPEESAAFKNLYAVGDEEYERMLQEWDKLSLDNLTAYTVDTAKANALLDAAGWTLNKAGEAWQMGSDEIRCKMIDGELVALELSMMYPKGNHIVDTMQENFIDNLNACGIALELVPTPMQDLLKSYYRETERSTDMIYLATNFHVLYDPSITYSTDQTLGHKIWNNTYSDDEKLYRLAVEMRKTEPGDFYGYVTKWIAFQERYNEVLPAIPVYSNIYYDFYVPELQSYSIRSHATWSQAAVFSYLIEQDEIQ